MKNTMKRLIFGFLAIVLTLGITSCGDEDPKPSLSNVEKVKAELKNTWSFASVTVTYGNTSATTSECEKNELENAKFPNDKWKDVTPEPNLIYSGINSVGYNLPCLIGNPTNPLTWTIIDNNDDTITLTLSNGRAFLISINDIQPLTIKAKLINDVGYTVVYVFNK